MRRHVLGGLLVLCLVTPGPEALAQDVPDPVADVLAAVPTPPIAFVAITPCRLADTRGGPGFPIGPFGPPSLIAVTPRVFPIAGNCGIPATALAVSANMAVTNTSGNGFISVWPEGAVQPSPPVASLNYSAGQTIANAVLAPLGNPRHGNQPGCRRPPWPFPGTICNWLPTRDCSTRSRAPMI